MSADVPATTGSRRAALAVHALGPIDQDWLLRALPAHHRSVIEPLLAELRGLGIPPDGALAADAVTPAPGPVEPGMRLEQLPDGSARALAELLQREPPALAARLLALRPWPWRSAVEEDFHPDFVAALGSVGPPRCAPALDTALCEAVLGTVPAEPPARGAAAWLRAGSQAFQRWRGGWR